MPWKRGQWWAVCDVCGFEFLSGKLKKRWDGLMVDDACFETRHPQEFVRSVKESTIPWSRPEPTAIDIGPSYPEWLYPPPVGNVNYFFGGEVIPGPVDVVPDLFTNTNTFYEHAIRPSVTLTVPLFTNTNTFYEPLVTHVVAPQLLTNTNTFYAPSVSYTINAPLFTNTNTFYSPSVENYLQILEPSLFSNTSTFYGPTVAPGAITLTPSLLSNTNTFYAPEVISDPETAGTLKIVYDYQDDGEGGQVHVGTNFMFDSAGSHGSLTNTAFAGPTTTRLAMPGTGDGIWNTSTSNATVLATYKGIEFDWQDTDYGPYFLPFDFKSSSTSTNVTWYSGGSTGAIPGTPENGTKSGTVTLKGSHGVVSPFFHAYADYPHNRAAGNSSSSITYTLKTDGSITIKNESGTDVSTQFSANLYWWSGKTTPPTTYYCKFTKRAETLNGGTATATTGVLALSSDRSVTLTAASSVTTSDVTYYVDVFSDSGGTNRVGRYKLALRVTRTS